MKWQYVAEKLASVERSDPADISRQFELKLVSEKAKRGYTDLDNAWRRFVWTRSSSACPMS